MNHISSNQPETNLPRAALPSADSAKPSAADLHEGEQDALAALAEREAQTFF